MNTKSHDSRKTRMKLLEPNSKLRDTHVLNIEIYITFPEIKNLGSLIIYIMYLYRFFVRINDHRKITSKSFDCRSLILILICKIIKYSKWILNK